MLYSFLHALFGRCRTFASNPPHSFTFLSESLHYIPPSLRQYQHSATRVTLNLESVLMRLIWIPKIHIIQTRVPSFSPYIFTYDRSLFPSRPIRFYVRKIMHAYTCTHPYSLRKTDSNIISPFWLKATNVTIRKCCHLMHSIRRICEQ